MCEYPQGTSHQRGKCAARAGSAGGLRNVGAPERYSCRSWANPDYRAHQSAVIDSGCQIGEGTQIWHFSHIMSGSQLGKKCNVGQNVVISPGVRVGNNVKIQNNVSVYTGVELEDDVFCGPSMVFTNVINPRSHVSPSMSTGEPWCEEARLSELMRPSSAA